MAKLSPAAQAVLHAFWDAPVSPSRNVQVAAALRALADQVVPVEASLRRGARPGGTGSIAPNEFKQDQRSETRRKILAIAAELKGSLLPRSCGC